jgi:tetratricopeptide (TPR) repeat protein
VVQRCEIRLRLARRLAASGDGAAAREVAIGSLALARDAGDAAAEARAHRTLAEADWLFGSIEAALDEYEKAATISMREGDVEDAVRAFIGASLAGLHLGQTRAALTSAESAVRAASTSDDLALRSDAQRQLGNATREMGRSARARAYYRLAVRNARAAGCLEREAKALNNLGTVDHFLGDVTAALEAFERSIALKERAGAMASALLGYNNVAALQSALGQWEQARRTLDRIFESPAADLVVARPIALSNLGDLEVACERLDEAVAAYGEGVALCRERSLLMPQTHGLSNLARALLMRDGPGDRDAAEACLRELAQLAARLEVAEVRRRLHAARSVAESVAGRTREAVREARAAVRARDRHTRFSDLFHTPIEARWILALALARDGRTGEAERQSKRAERELQQLAAMLSDPALRVPYLRRHPLHAAVLAGVLDLPTGWTWPRGGAHPAG